MSETKNLSLTRLQLLGLLKLGDSLIPGYGPLPAFSQTIPHKRIERATLGLDPRAKTDLLFLATLALAIPRPLLALAVPMMNLISKKTLIRLKGFYFTVYFSNDGQESNPSLDPAKIIGYQPKVS